MGISTSRLQFGQYPMSSESFKNEGKSPRNHSQAGCFGDWIRNGASCCSDTGYGRCDQEHSAIIILIQYRRCLLHQMEVLFAIYGPALSKGQDQGLSMRRRLTLSQSASLAAFKSSNLVYLVQPWIMNVICNKFETTRGRRAYSVGHNDVQSTQSVNSFFDKPVTVGLDTNILSSSA